MYLLPGILYKTKGQLYLLVSLQPPETKPQNQKVTQHLLLSPGAGAGRAPSRELVFQRYLPGLLTQLGPQGRVTNGHHATLSLLPGLFQLNVLETEVL